jgi:zinc transporter ZupT
MNFVRFFYLGELENFHPWICALAGGMFVYIGLTDMVPELISMGNEIEKDYSMANKPVGKLLKIRILFTQNLGVIIGIVTMFLLAKYGQILSRYF